jgi:hypothetical protein
VRLEELDAERLGELAQLDRYGRLGEVERLRGARDTAEARDGLEHEQLGQQPVTEETAQRLRIGHLGSLSDTEVSLAAHDAVGRPGMIGIPY